MTCHDVTQHDMMRHDMPRCHAIQGAAVEQLLHGDLTRIRSTSEGQEDAVKVTPSVKPPAPALHTTQSPPQAKPPPTLATYRTRLAEFYQQANPEKIAGIDTMLAKYRGNEQSVFMGLAEKYPSHAHIIQDLSSAAPTKTAQGGAVAVLQGGAKQEKEASTRGRANSLGKQQKDVDDAALQKAMADGATFLP